FASSAITSAAVAFPRRQITCITCHSASEIVSSAIVASCDYMRGQALCYSCSHSSRRSGSICQKASSGHFPCGMILASNSCASPFQQGERAMASRHNSEQEPSRKQLIELLNEDLSREYQAIIAYVVYSQVLKGAQYMKIAEELQIHAAEELQH